MDGGEIWQAAQFLVRQYDDPELIAARRVDAVVAARLPAAVAAWKMIFSAIRELQRVELLPGESVH
jgi:hypothetical protein